MKIISGTQDFKPFPVALVVSRFNPEITEALADGAVMRLKELKFLERDVTLAWVPGACEIPIAVQRFAEMGAFSAIIALGSVIRGETPHFDYVCQQVSMGCQTVALKHNVPVIFGVLTTNDDAQAQDRIGGAHGHKGRDAVDAAVEIVSVLRKVGI